MAPSRQALVGIRSTMGLTSRAGVVPLNLLADIAGPMARSVEDAVAVFQVIVGEDPEDPVTLAQDYVQPGLRPSGRPFMRQAEAFTGPRCGSWCYGPRLPPESRCLDREGV